MNGLYRDYCFIFISVMPRFSYKKYNIIVRCNYRIVVNTIIMMWNVPIIIFVDETHWPNFWEGDVLWIYSVTKRWPVAHVHSKAISHHPKLTQALQRVLFIFCLISIETNVLDYNACLHTQKNMLHIRPRSIYLYFINGRLV